MVLAFVGWLISVRKVSSISISQYLSGLRIIHLKKGVWPTSLRPDIVKSILKGHEHEAMKTRIPRLPMTIPVMRLLKKKLTMSKMPLSDKRLLWAVCCIALHGSFRIHELLSRNEMAFDPITLLGKDLRKLQIKLEGKLEDVMVIHLKHPKEDSLGKGVNIELFSTNTVTCPVDAFVKWQKASTLRINQVKPLFRFENGKCLTGATFNKVLKYLLYKHIDYDEGKFLGHSFRSGFASISHSQAFMAYCKTGRGSRMKE